MQPFFCFRFENWPVFWPVQVVSLSSVAMVRLVEEPLHEALARRAMILDERCILAAREVQRLEKRNMRKEDGEAESWRFQSQEREQVWESCERVRMHGADLLHKPFNTMFPWE